MNYDKLSRSLRYYYEKGIMQKVKEISEDRENIIQSTCVQGGACANAPPQQSSYKEAEHLKHGKPDEDQHSKNL